jgi:hypothetical protein
MAGQYLAKILMTIASVPLVGTLGSSMTILTGERSCPCGLRHRYHVTGRANMSWRGLIRYNPGTHRGVREE